MSFPIVNAGLTFFYNSQKITSKVSSYGGVAVSNMNRPNESFVSNGNDKLPLLLKVHGGVDHPLTSVLSISYNFLWMNQNGLNQINGGAYLSHRSHAKIDPMIVTFGTWYRLGDSFIVLAGFSKSHMSFGFSYDVNASALRSAAGMPGAYEVSFAYRYAKVKSLHRFATPLL
jgi:type IX secretion system PorP/SprF family membrane protein